MQSFLDKLNDLRTRLAETLYALNHDHPALNPDGEFDFSRLQRAVQRLLDRLVIIQIIDDKGLLTAQPGILSSELDIYYQDKETPLGGFKPLLERLRWVFDKFNDRYN